MTDLERLLPRFTLATAALAAAMACQPAHAQVLFPEPREFVVERACDATRSIRTQSDPVPLEVGRTYVGSGLNRASNATHVFIRVGETSRWVEIGCGRLGEAAAAPSPARPGGVKGDDSACLPFFDDETKLVEVKVGGRVDITPKAPVINDFDKAIVATCGAPGKAVTGDEIASLLRAHPDVLDRIKAFTAGKVFAGRAAHQSTEAYLADLTRAWTANRGFTHIFCGEPGSGSGKIGGLHFHARYLQLQNDGLACRMPNYRQNEVVPGVTYTMGVLMKNAEGQFVRDARKGYGLTLSGEDLLKLATRAFAENGGERDDKSTACLVSVEDDGHKFKVVFARRAKGITTIYPDATPNGTACAAPVRLE
jgi:hypothetical protein